MEINTSKSQSNVSTTNNSRELLVYLNALSIPYMERMQALNSSLIWTKQVKNNKSQRISLFYVLSKVESSGIANKTIVTSNTSGKYINRPDIDIC